MLIPDDGRNVETCVEIIVHGACAQTFVLAKPNKTNCPSHNMTLQWNIFSNHSPPSTADVEDVFSYFFSTCMYLRILESLVNELGGRGRDLI